MKLEYRINGRLANIDVPDDTQFSTGGDVCLASEFNDPTDATDWYQKGYGLREFSSKLPAALLRESITDMVAHRIKEALPHKNLADFRLEKYHEYVSEEEHCGGLDSKLKRFYSRDAEFDDGVFIEIMQNELKKSLSYTPKGSVDEHWLIVRIVRPQANAFNPPHKDIYEAFDETGVCPQMVNAWVPVTGVSSKAGLALAPGSHHLVESDIERTTAGATMNGKKFSVNCIKSWCGNNELITVAPPEGEMLIFSSHLIHGLGVNENHDITRVALEFRLHAS